MRALRGAATERYSEILAYLRRQGRPIPTHDLWIAASAMQHGLRRVTIGGHFFEHVPQVSCISITSREGEERR